VQWDSEHCNHWSRPIFYASGEGNETSTSSLRCHVATFRIAQDLPNGSHFSSDFSFGE
jgi:hypothetical protein